MKETAIYKAIERLNLPGVDVDHYIGNLLLFPENNWISPTNHGSNDYSICHHLAELNLIETRRLPSWSNDGLFRGNKVMFRYNRDLKYQL